MEEPVPTRPCSTPHSAPVAWIRSDPPALPPADAAPPTESETPADQNQIDAAISLILSNPDAVAELIERAAPVQRHDGWTGEKMATFLQVLADTGIVSDACRAAGMSREGVYPLRNRDPLFAAAWRAAQTKARPVLADGLVERSITGTVEHYYRDGVLVGERRHYESWLALAVLKRLDKQAEEDRRARRVQRTGEQDDGGGDPLAARIEDQWQQTLDALRGGGIAAAAAVIEPEVDEVDTPPPPGSDPSENCWKSDAGKWMTTFPPPPGFDGYESTTWDGFSWYERECSAEEGELLDAHEAGMGAEELAQFTTAAQAQRDVWFSRLRTEITACAAVCPEYRSANPN